MFPQLRAEGSDFYQVSYKKNECRLLSCKKSKKSNERFPRKTSDGRTFEGMENWNGKRTNERTYERTNERGQIYRTNLLCQWVQKTSAVVTNNIDITEYLMNDILGSVSLSLWIIAVVAIEIFAKRGLCALSLCLVVVKNRPIMFYWWRFISLISNTVNRIFSNFQR